MASKVLVKNVGALRIAPGLLWTQSTRTTTTKHYNPKFKKLRAEKYMKIDLPDYNSKINPQKIRQKMKERGVLPTRPWMERPFFIACTGATFEAYIPPEGDGKASLASPARAKQAVQLLEKKSKSMMAIRKIKSFEEDFDAKAFAQIAQQIYIKAHEVFINRNKRELRTLVTEKAYPEFRSNAACKTIHWKFLESLEPPRVVHARCTDIISKDNIFGQVTVRFHTRQQLAVYDRFGRLLYGSEILAKDVLEYVVFEKHLSNVYGTWRIHDKIIPDWAPPREPSLVTRIPRRKPHVALSDEKEKTEDLPAKVE